MDEKRKIMIEVVVGVVVLVVVVLLVVYAFHRNGNNPTAGQSSGTGNIADRLHNASSSGGTAVSSSIPTVAAIPAGAVAPNKGATSVAANVAVPVVQGAGSPSGNVSYRSFNISIDGNAYSPNTVIVKQGDTVNLELTAVDANYGFTQPNYGFNAAIAKGKTQTIQFQALQTGDFTFYCASCGGPSKGPVGHLIVTAN